MNILLLGPYRLDLIKYLESFGDKVLVTERPITSESEILKDIEFIISYGYRYILPKDLIDKFPDKAINLHISYLPWNRGADPNLWSFLEDTPKGVTIHKLAYGLDKGDILVQQEVSYNESDTLRTSYERLSSAIEELFKRVWPEIRKGKIKAYPQSHEGSYHCLKDRVAYEHLLIKGWDTPVKYLIGKASELIHFVE